MFDFKENSRLVSSILLILIIPILIAGNQLWQTHNANDLLATELKEKAIMTAKTVSVAAADNLNNLPVLQQKIATIAQENPEIAEITIIQKVSDNFVATASTNSQLSGVNFASEKYINVWTENSLSEELVKDTTANERMWSVIVPISDSNNQKVALSNVKISLKDIDSLTKKNLNASFTVLAIIIFLVILFLLNHFRFIEYAFSFKKLKEIDRMKDDFISITSHELKTPMVTIKGYISMLLEGVVGKFDDKTRSHLQKIYNNVQKLDQLVAELLDVSRLSQGRMQFDMQPYDIIKIVNQTIDNLQDEAKEKNLTLEAQKPQNLPPLFVDPDRTRQIIDNLINNAIKYTFKGGVTISYQVTTNKVQVIIKDTGLGIAPEDAKRLFTKFYRIKNEKTADIAGTGLGLWLAREMARHMNGDIFVRSTVNVGSEFIVSLPYIKEK